MRSRAGTVGMVVLAALVAAPAASGSTASVRGGSVIVYEGDADADDVTIDREVDRDGDVFYLVRDADGISSGDGCSRQSRRVSACQVSASLKSYEVATGAGDDRVEIAGATTGGSADLGSGDDGFTGLESGTAADAVDGGDGSDALDGGAGNDPLDGQAGNDSVAGGA